MKGIWRQPQVLEYTGLSASTLHRRVKAGTFPGPVRLGGGRLIGWMAVEVEEWVASLPRAAA